MEIKFLVSFPPSVPGALPSNSSDDNFDIESFKVSGTSSSVWDEHEAIIIDVKKRFKKLFIKTPQKDKQILLCIVYNYKLK